MKHKFLNDTLYLYFYGDLDHHSILNLKDITIDLINSYQPKCVKMDFEEVEFIDSTGIGYVLARYKQLKSMNCNLILCNLSELNQTIFHMSGIFQIMKHEKNGEKV